MCNCAFASVLLASFIPCNFLRPFDLLVQWLNSIYLAIKSSVFLNVRFTVTFVSDPRLPAISDLRVKKGLSVSWLGCLTASKIFQLWLLQPNLAMESIIDNEEFPWSTLVNLRVDYLETFLFRQVWDWSCAYIIHEGCRILDADNMQPHTFLHAHRDEEWRYR